MGASIKFSEPKSLNYCASVVQINNIVPLENCDNVTSTIIFGFPVIISKDVQIGDVGIYFPPETQLSERYCSENNLYRHAEKNSDTSKKGYIEDTRRIRTVRFRGNQSVGLFMPLTSMTAFCKETDFAIGDTFDMIGNEEICRKYLVKQPQVSGSEKKTKKIKASKVLDHQFRFHVNTQNLGRCVNVIKPEDIITITRKMHGTSVVCSNVLCKTKLTWKDKLAKFLGVKVAETAYDNIYSSRKVVKNEDLTAGNHFYDVDIWGEANNRVKHALREGITIYSEIVGYLPSGSNIQSLEGKCYDYGCEKGTFEVYVYRVTYTSPAGDVFEFSSKQLQEFCKEQGLNAVEEYYHGPAQDLCDRFNQKYTSDTFGEVFINLLRELYLEKDCSMCTTPLPDEGIVVRREANYIDVYKLKSIRFLEGETKEIDKGNENLEDNF